MKKSLISLSLFFILINTNIFPQVSKNTFEFLRVDMSSRAAALGGTFNSSNDDVDVIFYNPAGLGLLSDMPLSINYINYLLDINLASLAFSKNFEKLGRFAAGIKYINYGDFYEADDSGNKTGNYNAGEFAFLVGYSNRLDNNFYYGANIKFIYSSIQDYSSTAIAFDLGLHYTFPEQLFDVSFSILNIGTQLSKYIDTEEDLPLDFTLGASKKIEHLPLKLFLDFHKLNDDYNDFFERFKTFSIGGEFALSKALTLRVGYDNEKREDLKIGTFSGLAGFNFGIGINIQDYKFNYAYSSFGEVGALHRIGLTTSF